ncbi:MAG: hypothetical protein LBN00_07675 [Oscillospiraceae bacterium]|nr:hypothetical protein [Oscillospiraceae bacterium]
MQTKKHRNIAAIVLVTVGILVLVAAAAVSLARIISSGRRLDEDSIPVSADNAFLVASSYEILGYIKNDDYAALSKIAHPTYGVLFSPYATIAEASAKVFTPTAILAFATDKTEYVWGVRDGSAEPIALTPREYFAEFVFDRDYTHASVIGVNRIVKTGNSLENITDVRPNVRFVDFHIPADTEGSDWGSLRLGFEEYNGNLMLSIILHSERTV